MAKRFYTLRLSEHTWKKLKWIIQNDVVKLSLFPSVSELIDYMCDLYFEQRNRVTARALRPRRPR